MKITLLKSKAFSFKQYIKEAIKIDGFYRYQCRNCLAIITLANKPEELESLYCQCNHPNYRLLLT